jgi:hypothetical protein
MTHDEETMIRGGEKDAVRDYRRRFRSVIAPELVRRVEDVLERSVVSYPARCCSTQVRSGRKLQPCRLFDDGPRSWRGVRRNQRGVAA